jgi:hypothetical protein
MATGMGLGARAMNLPITIAESNAGLVPPAVATMLLGAGGAFLLVFQVRARAGVGGGLAAPSTDVEAPAQGCGHRCGPPAPPWECHR